MPASGQVQRPTSAWGVPFNWAFGNYATSDLDQETHLRDTAQKRAQAISGNVGRSWIDQLSKANAQAEREAGLADQGQPRASAMPSESKGAGA